MLSNGKTYFQFERKHFDEVGSAFRYERKEGHKVFLFIRDTVECPDQEYVLFDFSQKDSTIWPLCRENEYRGLGSTRFFYVDPFQAVMETKTFHYVRIENGDTTWDPLGNYEWFHHIAKGGGRIQQVIEPIGEFIIRGAIINGVEYGTILSVNNNTSEEYEMNLSVYPNPFNSSTQIEYSVKETDFVKIYLVNILGQHVLTVMNEIKSPGQYRSILNLSSLPSGIYLINLRTSRFMLSKEILLIK